MKVFIAGGTGFIGGHISQMLVENDVSVVIATRYPERYDSPETGLEEDMPADQGDQPKGTVRYVGLGDDMTDAIRGCRVVINLAGESLSGKRWSATVKKRLYNSRVQITRSLSAAIRKTDTKPELFISASGINYYGDSGEELVTESRGPGKDFLATLCRDWEEAALEARKAGVRVVTPRIGVVMGNNGGALSVMLPVFRAFVGGAIGPGTQYFPWIHVDDLCGLFRFLMDHDHVEGPVNATAPEQVTMDDFAATLGSVLSRPYFLKVPKLLLNLVLGEAAVMLTSSLRVEPEVAKKSGFEYRYPELRPALEHLLSGPAE